MFWSFLETNRALRKCFKSSILFSFLERDKHQTRPHNNPTDNSYRIEDVFNSIRKTDIITETGYDWGSWYVAPSKRLSNCLLFGLLESFCVLISSSLKGLSFVAFTKFLCTSCPHLSGDEIDNFQFYLHEDLIRLLKLIRMSALVVDPDEESPEMVASFPSL